MIILMDQDGPLADFDGAFWGMCAREGITLDCERHEQRHRFATDHIPDRHERQQARKIVDGTRWFLDLPVTPGAQEGMAMLAETGHEVWIVTKPLEANPWCRDDKAAWIRRHFGEVWEQRLILAPDKSLVHGDLLLDDAPKPKWFDRASWEPVVFEMSWNGPGSQWDGLRRWNWDTIGDLL